MYRSARALCLAGLLPLVASLAAPTTAVARRGISPDTRGADHSALRQAEMLERELLGLVATERAQQRLPRLAADETLSRAARLHSRDMQQHGYFDHFSPNPTLRTPTDRYRMVAGRTGRYPRIGENIFRGAGTSVHQAHVAFMGSPPHRDNLLRRDWKRVGVGVQLAPDGRLWVTQMFAD
jgi:uncharacterized protein YkwD